MIPFSAKRYEDEDFSTYKLRQWTENQLFKQLMRPRLFWNSAVNGTYVAAKEAGKFKLSLEG